MAASALLATIAGCGVFHRPSTPAEQFDDANSKRKWGGAMGRLDANLLGVNDHDEAKSPQVQIGSFTLLGLIHGELCFTYEADGPLHEKAADVLEGRKRFMERSTWVFEAHDSIATIRDGWPDHARSHVTRTTVSAKKVVDRGWTDKRDGKYQKHLWLISRIESCGPAPQIKPTTKYVTISRFGGDPPALLVWKLDAPPSAEYLAAQGRSDGEAPAEPTATATPDAAAPSEPRDEFVPGASSIMKTLTDAGEFKEFTAMLKETGVDREIASGGPYTILAPTDATIAKLKDQSFRRDKDLLKRSVRDLIVVGVVTKGEQTLKTLAGTDARLELSKSGRLKRRGSATLDLLGSATNGVIYLRK